MAAAAAGATAAAGTRLVGAPLKSTDVGASPAAPFTAIGAPFVAIDLFGAGLHERVLVSTDGLGARHLVHDETSPIRMFIQGIIDEKQSL